MNRLYVHIYIIPSFPSDPARSSQITGWAPHAIQQLRIHCILPSDLTPLQERLPHLHQIIRFHLFILTVELDHHTDFYPAESPSWHALPPGSVISFCFSSRFPPQSGVSFPASFTSACLLCSASSLVTCTDPSSPACSSRLGHTLRPESSFPVPLLMGSVHAPPQTSFWLPNKIPAKHPSQHGMHGSSPSSASLISCHQLLPLKPHQPPPWSEIGCHPHTHFLSAWVTSSWRPHR